MRRPCTRRQIRATVAYTLVCLCVFAVGAMVAEWVWKAGGLAVVCLALAALVLGLQGGGTIEPRLERLFGGRAGGDDRTGR